VTPDTNDLGQPIGFPVPGWATRQLPSRTPMAGRFCRVEPLDAERHARDLHAANSEDRDGRLWTYLPWGPHAGFEDYLAALEAGLQRQDRTHRVPVVARGDQHGVDVGASGQRAEAVHGLGVELSGCLLCSQCHLFANGPDLETIPQSPQSRAIAHFPVWTQTN